MTSCFREEFSLDDTAEAAASSLGDIDAETLVKDYWVTQVLRVLARDYRTFFVFKGGTSLTKALHCVDRFSEDIDILMVGKPDEISYDTLMKRLATSVEAATGLVGELGDYPKRNVFRDYTFTYETQHRDLLRPEIKLEMGVRGTDTPDHLVCPIRPLLADVSRDGFEAGTYEDLVEFEVDVLHPARTLWEKTVLLHSAAERGELQDPQTARSSRLLRHYGDIAALLDRTDVRQVLANQSNRELLDSEVRYVSGKYFGPLPDAPAGGYAMSSAFRPSPEARKFLDQRFGEMIETLWGPHNRPSMQGVLDAVSESASLLDPNH